MSRTARIRFREKDSGRVREVTATLRVATKPYRCSSCSGEIWGSNVRRWVPSDQVGNVHQDCAEVVDAD